MRILVVKLSSMGDILHALPTAHALSRHFDTRLDWAVQAEYERLLRCVPIVDRIIPVHRHQWWRHAPKALQGIRRVRYDLVVDLQGLLKSAVVARLARAQRRIGPSYHREGSRMLYDCVPGRADRSRHAVFQAMDVLELLGIPRPETPSFPLRFPAFGLSPAGPRIGIAPVSRWPSKNWPLEHFKQLCRLMQTELGAQIVLIGSRQDQEACRGIAAACALPAMNTSGALDLPRLGGLLGELDLLIANDSGPLHLAAALGKPCVVFYGPTAPGRTGPLGPRHCLLQPDVPCLGCHRRRCVRHEGHCLARITPEEAFTAVQRCLAGTVSEKRTSDR